MKVSVIMPVYNSIDFLEKSCISFLNQTLDDIELICINDGSTDGSLEFLLDLSKRNSSIKVFSQENQGSGKARNKGIDEATGDYIAFLDADDIFIDKSALEMMYIQGSRNNADMVAANLKRVSKTGVIEKNFNYDTKHYAYCSKKEVIDPINYGVPLAFYKNIYKRSFLNQHNIRFPDLRRGQDPVFLAEILTKINEIYTVNVDLYGYNYSALGGAHSKVDNYDKKYDYITHFKNTFDILKKANYTTILTKYEDSFIKYLKSKRNKDDDELKTIVYDIFNNLEEYFDKDSYPYYYLKVNNSDYKNSNKKIDEVLSFKFDLIRKSLRTDYFINDDELKEFINLESKYSDNPQFLRKSYVLMNDLNENSDKDYQKLKNDETYKKFLHDLQNKI